MHILNMTEHVSQQLRQLPLPPFIAQHIVGVISIQDNYMCYPHGIVLCMGVYCFRQSYICKVLHDTGLDPWCEHCFKKVKLQVYFNRDGNCDKSNCLNIGIRFINNNKPLQIQSDQQKISDTMKCCRKICCQYIDKAKELQMNSSIKIIKQLSSRDRYISILQWISYETKLQIMTFYKLRHDIIFLHRKMLQP